MSKKSHSKATPAPKRASPSSRADLAAQRGRTLGVAAIGAVAAVAGAAWFGLFGPLFRAPAATGADEDASSGSTASGDTYQQGLTPTAGVAAASSGGTAPMPVVAAGGGHPVPDLAPDAPPPGTERAVEAFRPDPTAPISPEEREALRPATGPSPSLVADRGEMRMQTSPANTADSLKDVSMVTRTASARYEGLGKAGKGSVSTQSGVLSDQPYGFNTRFEDGAGTNPEELVAAAHASCFTMALSFALAAAGHADGTLETKAAVKLDKDGDGFKVSSSALTLTARVPGIDPAEFERIAQEAKAGCPISKLLNTQITLDATLA